MARLPSNFIGIKPTFKFDDRDIVKITKINEADFVDKELWAKYVAALGKELRVTNKFHPTLKDFSENGYNCVLEDAKEPISSRHVFFFVESEIELVKRGFTSPAAYEGYGDWGG